MTRAGHLAAEVGDEVAGLAAVEAAEHRADDLANVLGVLGDALRREGAAHELLEAVVAGRVHGDHLQPLDVEWRADVVDEEDAPLLRAEGLEVPRRGEDVLGPGERPEPALVRDTGGSG